MAVLMYHSGRSAAAIAPANRGKKFPANSPATRAIMNPASEVRFMDQGMPKPLSLS